MTFRPLLLVLGLGLTASGCYDDDYDYPPVYDEGVVAVCEAGVVVAGIDRGGFLDLEPGRGAGAIVEYAGEGAWRVAVTCDTALSGYDCLWDLEVTPIDAPIIELMPEGLEDRDSLGRFVLPADMETVGFVSETATDLDAFTLVTDPGAGLRVDALLDGACAGPFVSWIEESDVVASRTQVMDIHPLEP